MAEGLRIRDIDEAMLMAWVATDCARPEGFRRADIEVHDSEFPVIQCTPFLTAHELGERVRDAKAFIMIVFASGASPERLTPIIKAKVEAGCAVIFLSDNMGEENAPYRNKYEAGQASQEAGAVLLQKANVRHTHEVRAFAKGLLEQGITGKELAEVVRNQYAWQEGETPTIRPVPGARPEVREGDPRIEAANEEFRERLQGVQLSPEAIGFAMWTWGG